MAEFGSRDTRRIDGSSTHRAGRGALPSNSLSHNGSASLLPGLENPVGPMPVSISASSLSQDAHLDPHHAHHVRDRGLARVPSFQKFCSNTPPPTVPIRKVSSQRAVGERDEQDGSEGGSNRDHKLLPPVPESETSQTALRSGDVMESPSRARPRPQLPGSHLPRRSSSVYSRLPDASTLDLPASWKLWGKFSGVVPKIRPPTSTASSPLHDQNQNQPSVYSSPELRGPGSEQESDESWPLVEDEQGVSTTEVSSQLPARSENNGHDDEARTKSATEEEQKQPTLIGPGPSVPTDASTPSEWSSRISTPSPPPLPTSPSSLPHARSPTTPEVAMDMAGTTGSPHGLRVTDVSPAPTSPSLVGDRLTGLSPSPSPLSINSPFPPPTGPLPPLPNSPLPQSRSNEKMQQRQQQQQQQHSAGVSVEDFALHSNSSPTRGRSRQIQPRSRAMDGSQRDSRATHRGDASPRRSSGRAPLSYYFNTAGSSHHPLAFEDRHSSLAPSVQAAHHHPRTHPSSEEYHQLLRDNYVQFSPRRTPSDSAEDDERQQARDFRLVPPPLFWQQFHHTSKAAKSPERPLTAGNKLASRHLTGVATRVDGHVGQRADMAAEWNVLRSPSQLSDAIVTADGAVAEKERSPNPGPISQHESNNNNHNQRADATPSPQLPQSRVDSVQMLGAANGGISVASHLIGGAERNDAGDAKPSGKGHSRNFSGRLNILNRQQPMPTTPVHDLSYDLPPSRPSSVNGNEPAPITVGRRYMSESPHLRPKSARRKHKNSTPVPHTPPLKLQLTASLTPPDTHSPGSPAAADVGAKHSQKAHELLGMTHSPRNSARRGKPSSGLRIFTAALEKTREVAASLVLTPPPSSEKETFSFSADGERRNHHHQQSRSSAKKRHSSIRSNGTTGENGRRSSFMMAFLQERGLWRTSGSGTDSGSGGAVSNGSASGEARGAQQVRDHKKTPSATTEHVSSPKTRKSHFRPRDSRASAVTAATAATSPTVKRVSWLGRQVVTRSAEMHRERAKRRQRAELKRSIRLVGAADPNDVLVREEGEEEEKEKERERGEG